MGPPGAPQAPYPGKQYLIGGNWKCNGTKESTAALVATLNGAGDIPAWCEVVVGVPSIHIGSVMGTLRKDIAVAAQHCCGAAHGTGRYQQTQTVRCRAVARTAARRRGCRRRLGRAHHRLRRRRLGRR